jgi:ParB family transcriptional regulator, chromosome partitioning protein
MSMLFDEVPVVQPSTQNNEWYTPSKYVEAARLVMGAIDLDPASCEMANRTVKAERYYTREQNGLLQPWYGKMWCNPPFTAGISSPMPMFTWGRRLVEEYHKENVQQGILLIMACIKQKWFHTLWNMEDYPICFSSKRIYFHRPNGALQELRESTCFAYLGPNEQKFIEVFSQFGTIAKRVNVPQPKPSQPALWDEVAL